MFGSTFEALRAGGVTNVEENSAALQLLTTAPRAIGTWGLRGCMVVLIVFNQAAILAHFAHSGLESALDEVASLYTANKQLYFREEEEVWIVAGIVVGAEYSQAALDWQKQVVETRLARITGLPRPQSAHYSFHSIDGTDSPEFRDKGTVLVDARSGKVEVWIEDRLLYRQA